MSPLLSCCPLCRHQVAACQAVVCFLCCHHHHAACRVAVRWLHVTVCCCPHCHHCHAALHVTGGQLCVVWQCAAAHIAATAATVLLVISLLGDCVSCRGATCITTTLLIISLLGGCVLYSDVLLPMLPPPPRCSHVTTCCVAVGWLTLSWRVPLGCACTHMSEKKKKKNCMMYH